MRERIAVAVAAALALAGCTPDDQRLPFSLEDDRPVTRTVASAGPTTISSPAGISVTLPEGAVSPGTRVTVARLDPRDIGGGPTPFGGSVFLIGFDEAPRMDPRLSFTVPMAGSTTAAEVISAVPVLMRIGAPDDSPVASMVTSARRGTAATGAAGPASASGDPASIIKQLEALGFFSGIGVHGTVQDEPFTRNAIVQMIPALFGPPPPPGSGLFGGSGHAGYAYEPIPAAGAGLVFQPWRFDGAMIGELMMLLWTLSPEVAQELGLMYPHEGTWYGVQGVTTSAVSMGQLYPWVGHDGGARHPLIPPGESAARYTLACIGLDWDLGIPRCGEDALDVRASDDLLQRFPAGLLAVNYFIVDVTLNADGTATGTFEFDAALRLALASGITGYGVADAFSLSGSWSADETSIWIGGHEFHYTVTDTGELILGIEETVQLRNNDGTETEERVQVHVKLRRE